MDKRIFATGSRKTANAKVWLSPGKGELTVNKKPAPEYIGRLDLMDVVNAPLKVTGLTGQYDIACIVAGGGPASQAAAIALGVSRALVLADPELRKTLKSAALLKRDPREKERMKYGLAKRRKRFQWTKR
jgi:small subunit ribosomal protein S9